jgi:hypothetical protein
MWRISRRSGPREVWSRVAEGDYKTLKPKFDAMKETLDLDEQIQLTKAGF